MAHKESAHRTPSAKTGSDVIKQTQRPLASPLERVLHLQRQIGNQAISRAIQRRQANINQAANSTIQRDDRTPHVDLLTPQGFPQAYERFRVGDRKVYRFSFTNPLNVFANGFRKAAGYDDIVRHATENQGVGSNWVATSQTLAGMDERYGNYAFEIDLNGYQAIDVNAAYEAQAHRRNPFAEQQEIAVYREIVPAQIKAVWVRREQPILLKDPNMPMPWANYYDFYSKQDYIDKFT